MKTNFTLIGLIALLIYFPFLSMGQIEIDWDSEKKIKVHTVSDQRDSESLMIKVKALQIEDLSKIILQEFYINNTKDKTLDIEYLKNDFDEKVKTEDEELTIDLYRFLTSEEYTMLYDPSNNVKFKCIIEGQEEKKVILDLSLQGTTNEDQNIKTKNTVESLKLLPVPVFNENSEYPFKQDRKIRFLIIDCNPNILYKQNTFLYSRNEEVKVTNGIDEQFDSVFKKRRAIFSNGSISVLLKNYNLHAGEQLSVSLNNTNYSYEQDVKYLFNQIKGKPNEPSGDAKLESKEDKDSTKMLNQDPIISYLRDARLLLESYKSLNISDLYIIEEYKKNLIRLIDEHIDTLEYKTMEALGEIIYWSPDYISITPMPVEVGDVDEVNFKVTSMKNGKANEISVGTFKTRGGLGVNIGNLFYVTGLTNNNIYTKLVDVNDTTELRAVLDATNAVSVGIGLNAEVYFRTGSLVKPTVNLGFFIPLGQELVPNFAVGPGIVVGNKNVKLSLNGGLALGQTNEIPDRYQNKDISDVSDLTSLSTKVWKPSWYVGVGVSFNLTKK